MNWRKTLLRASFLLIIALFCLNAVAVVCRAQKSGQKAPPTWTEYFGLEKCSFSSAGKNDYFILEPNYRLMLRGIEDEDTVTLLITVLNETRQIGDVETRVVEERESTNGELVEISQNYYAFCQTTGCIFYFGEDVDIYKDGRIVSHEGGWRAGSSGAKAGLMMPGLPLLGARYYQEIAPDVAMDRAEIVSTSDTLLTPAGEFDDCLKTEETTPLEPSAKEYKIYAPGIGLIKDGDLLLVNHGLTNK